MKSRINQGILLSFGAESFVFHFPTQNYKDYSMQNYDTACYFIRVWNLISHNQVVTQADSAQE